MRTSNFVRPFWKLLQAKVFQMFLRTMLVKTQNKMPSFISQLYDGKRKKCSGYYDKQITLLLSIKHKNIETTLKTFEDTK